MSSPKYSETGRWLISPDFDSANNVPNVLLFLKTKKNNMLMILNASVFFIRKRPELPENGVKSASKTVNNP